MIALKEELFEAISKGVDGLIHVDSKMQTTSREAALECIKCSAEHTLPNHCNKPMIFEEGVFVCLECGETSQIPTHYGSLMHIVIK